MHHRRGICAFLLILAVSCTHPQRGAGPTARATGPAAHLRAPDPADSGAYSNIALRDYVGPEA